MICPLLPILKTEKKLYWNYLYLFLHISTILKDMLGEKQNHLNTMSIK